MTIGHPLSSPFARRRLSSGVSGHNKPASNGPSHPAGNSAQVGILPPKQARIKHFSPPGKGRLQRPSKSPWILADMLGCWWTCYYFSLSSLCKYLMMNDLEARGVEPLFPATMSSNVHGCFIRAILEANTLY